LLLAWKWLFAAREFVRRREREREKEREGERERERERGRERKIKRELRDQGEAIVVIKGRARRQLH